MVCRREMPKRILVDRFAGEMQDLKRMRNMKSSLVCSGESFDIGTWTWWMLVWCSGEKGSLYREGNLYSRTYHIADYQAVIRGTWP